MFSISSKWIIIVFQISSILTLGAYNPFKTLVKHSQGCFIATKNKASEIWEYLSDKNKARIQVSGEVAISIAAAFALSEAIVLMQGDAEEPQLFIAGMCAIPIIRNMQQIPLILEKKNINKVFKKFYSIFLKYGTTFGVTLSSILTNTLVGKPVLGPLALQFLLATYLLFLRDIADVSGRKETQTYYNQLLQGKEKLAEGASKLTETQENEIVLEEFIKLLERKILASTQTSSTLEEGDLENNREESHA